ncbi:condensation domain-containing protein [Nocardia sp. NPDC058497]|uniref:condensation domain-containing protein n=1 Tax=Nocardia sp. NPDC058497 TaxID=3346529 RepID=UPI00364E5B4D
MSTSVGADPHPIELVTSLWMSMLEYEDPLPEDNWFDLGGDSLGAVQLIARLERLDVRVGSTEFFAAPTLETLLACADSQSGRGQISTEEIASASHDLPLTPTQLYTVVADGPTRDWHNDHFTVALCEHADRGRLGRALADLVTRHPALTARFLRSERGWTQSVTSADQRVIALIDVPVEGLHDVGPVKTAVDHWGARFDLARGPLCVALVWNTDSGPLAVTVLLHHLCVDGHSIGVLHNDLVTALHEKSDIETTSDNYVAWLTHVATHDFVRADLASTDQGTVPMQSLRTTTVELDVGSLHSRHIAPALVAAFSRTARDRVDPSRNRLDFTWHGRDVAAGWPSLANTVGWFAQIRRLVLPNDGAWSVTDAEVALAEATDGDYLVDDFTGRLLAQPARLYLNYRGALLTNLHARIGDCQPMDVDFGPQSSPDAITGHHLRCVADRFGDRVRLSIKYRPDSSLAAAGLDALAAGLER